MGRGLFVSGSVLDGVFSFWFVSYFDAQFFLSFFFSLSHESNTSHHIKFVNSLSLSFFSFFFFFFLFFFQARTQQLSVVGNVCLARGCAGRMKADFGDKQLHNQLKAFETSFDYKR